MNNRKGRSRPVRQNFQNVNLPEENHKALTEALEVHVSVVLGIRVKDDVTKHLQDIQSSKLLKSTLTELLIND